MKKYHQMLKKSINKKACENYLLMIPIRKVALWNKNVKTTSHEEVNAIFDIVCQVKHELLQIKYLQAPKMRGCRRTLSVSNLRSLYTSQTSSNGTPAIPPPCKAAWSHWQD
jgi:hypothetical protein